mmetsp:Transcript_108233/g.305025  ORF Transcript_108233/g.305025 Transcript_108233/m.305025 type:complete len:236 (-) Transcript_108233:963-1670(-)
MGGSHQVVRPTRRALRASILVSATSLRQELLSPGDVAALGPRERPSREKLRPLRRLHLSERQSNPTRPFVVGLGALEVPPVRARDGHVCKEGCPVRGAQRVCIFPDAERLGEVREDAFVVGAARLRPNEAHDLEEFRSVVRLDPPAGLANALGLDEAIPCTSDVALMPPGDACHEDDGSLGDRLPRGRLLLPFEPRPPQMEHLRGYVVLAELQMQPRGPGAGQGRGRAAAPLFVR